MLHKLFALSWKEPTTVTERYAIGWTLTLDAVRARAALHNPAPRRIVEMTKRASNVPFLLVVSMTLFFWVKVQSVVLAPILHWYPHVAFPTVRA